MFWSHNTIFRGYDTLKGNFTIHMCANVYICDLKRPSYISIIKGVTEHVGLDVLKIYNQYKYINFIYLDSNLNFIVI
jgi:hypothetical protein